MRGGIFILGSGRIWWKVNTSDIILEGIYVNKCAHNC